MTDNYSLKPRVITTVPLCYACKGGRKVPVVGTVDSVLSGNPGRFWVPCFCVLETLEACEARIAGLERLVLQLNGCDMSMLGDPAKPTPVDDWGKKALMDVAAKAADDFAQGKKINPYPRGSDLCNAYNNAWADCQSSTIGDGDQ